jgi:2-dehydropantoate 2-reductase
MMKKICIVGAGAIGGFVGARLTKKGDVQVSALARGATLAALRTHGWRLQEADSLIQAPATASDQPEQIGVQDCIIIAVKGPALPALARSLAPMIGPQTVVMPAMNGVPWWFANGLQISDQSALQSVDPGGVIAASLPAARIIGCVIHASTFTSEPGMVHHKMGNGLIIGAVNPELNAHVHALQTLLKAARFECNVSSNIRYDIWYKLWGNMTMNPLSAITGATSDRILDDQLLKAFCSSAMLEAGAIGTKIGCPIEQSPQDRHEITRKLGAFKTSMLQDVEAGRAIELDALVGAARELGERTQTPTPYLDALYGITRLFAQTKGLYPK